MFFNSTVFLFLFLPFSIIIYYLSPRKIKPITMLVLSLIFCSWSIPKLLPLLVLTITLDYWIAKRILHAEKKIHWLYLSLVLNIGLLFYFKYTNFFISELNRFLSHDILWIQPLIPLGISFFTFKKISFLVDTYYGAIPEFSFLEYAQYVLFFPQLSSGPISRYREFIREPGLETVFNGCFRLSLGLFKKFILADSIAKIADSVFSLGPSELTTSVVWLGIFSYTIQIYFDFSAYTDMAIGIAEIFGYRSPENFNQPYISKSITEFWRRWHMTLSRFFRDYVYIPLGGNRCSTIRNYVNLWVVFSLTGFWHGADWTFILWGMYHGFLLTIERLFNAKLWKLPALLKQGLTFVLVMIGWAIFRAEGVRFLIKMFTVMFGFSNAPYEPYLVGVNGYTLSILLISFIFSIIDTERYAKAFLNNLYVKGFATVGCLVLALIRFSATSFSPFIYFKF